MQHCLVHGSCFWLLHFAFHFCCCSAALPPHLPPVCPFMVYGEITQRLATSMGTRLRKWPREPGVFYWVISVFYWVISVFTGSSVCCLGPAKPRWHVLKQLYTCSVTCHSRNALYFLSCFTHFFQLTHPFTP